MVLAVWGGLLLPFQRRPSCSQVLHVPSESHSKTARAPTPQPLHVRPQAARKAFTWQQSKGYDELVDRKSNKKHRVLSGARMPQSGTHLKDSANACRRAGSAAWLVLSSNPPACSWRKARQALAPCGLPSAKTSAVRACTTAARSFAVLADGPPPPLTSGCTNPPGLQSEITFNSFTKDIAARERLAQSLILSLYKQFDPFTSSLIHPHQLNPSTDSFDPSTSISSIYVKLIPFRTECLSDKPSEHSGGCWAE